MNSNRLILKRHVWRHPDGSTNHSPTGPLGCPACAELRRPGPRPRMSSDEVTDGFSLDMGVRMARTVFEKRGNHSEAHLSEKELGAMLGLAFQLGREEGR